MRITSYLLLLSVFLGLFPPLSQAATLLIVEDETRIIPRAEPYIYQGIIIESGGTLTIEAGVTISFTPASVLSIHGTLITKGTKSKPVFFQSSDSTEMWEGIRAESQSQVSLTNTVLSLFTGPHRLPGHAVLAGVTLRDGSNNQILVTGHSPTQGFFPKNLTFENHLLGSVMQGNGLLLEGTFQNIFLTDVIFTDTRIPYQPAIAKIYSTALYNSLQLIRLDFGYGCRSQTQTDYTKPLPRPVAVTARITSCVTSTTPVLFVPGYGTSINLKFLSKSASSSTTTDWHFSKKLSKPYFTYLQSLTDNKIPYEVAYYDWRLPAAEAASKYLIPALAKLKSNTNAKSVNIVAHSFGGLVARSYLQGSDYKGDVLNLVTLGTPHQGTAKVYSTWEAGILPPDWSVMNSLIRLYAYQHRHDRLTNQDVVHRYFRSAQDLLPTYPALIYEDTLQSMSNLYYRNNSLTELKRTEPLLYQRTRTLSIYGTEVETLETVITAYPPHKTQKLWPDGEPISKQPALSKVGDGTVPQKSAVLEYGRRHQVEAKHAEIPGVVTEYLLKDLYGATAKEVLPYAIPATKLFAFDCPIRVHLILPDGEIIVSDSKAESSVEIEESDEMLWMLAPAMEGTYQVYITALDDAEVRAWVDSSEIRTFTMKKDEEVRFSYSSAGLAALEKAPLIPMISPRTEDSNIQEPPLILSFTEMPSKLGDPNHPLIPHSPFAALLPVHTSRVKLSKKEHAQKLVEPSRQNREKPYVAAALLAVGLAILYRRQRE